MAKWQTFDSSGTWYKPSDATVVEVHVWAGGGGGASGRFGAVSTTRGGGGPGAGGGYCHQVFPASILGASEVVTVGSGGAGGAAVSTPGGADGNDGSSGNDSTFGSWVKARGGGGGIKGTSAGVGTSGAIVTTTVFDGIPGAGMVSSEQSGGAGAFATVNGLTAANVGAPAGGTTTRPSTNRWSVVWGSSATPGRPMNIGAAICAGIPGRCYSFDNGYASKGGVPAGGGGPGSCGTENFSASSFAGGAGGGGRIIVISY